MKFNQRVACISARNELSKDERLKYSDIICEKLKELLKDKKNIMSYKAIGNEVDVEEFNSHFEDLAYPVTLKKGVMEAHKGKGFTKGKFKISEPFNGKKIDPMTLEYIIVPLVGFDEKLNRLGHGWGYYDRFLKNTKAIKIGVAFEIQKVDQIITDENDVPLDMVITEKNIYQ